jgi:flagellar protein FliS
VPLTNPYQRYQHTAAQTADGGQLLLMSYEATLRWLSRAEAAIQQDKIEEAHQGLMNAQEILRNLKLNLDHSASDVAGNLDRIYDYLIAELVWANVHKDLDRIRNVRDMITPLLDAWRVAVVKARRESPAHAAQATEAILGNAGSRA